MLGGCPYVSVRTKSPGPSPAGPRPAAWENFPHNETRPNREPSAGTPE